jgi:hypothetical protein
VRDEAQSSKDRIQGSSGSGTGSAGPGY